MFLVYVYPSFFLAEVLDTSWISSVVKFPLWIGEGTWLRFHLTEYRDCGDSVFILFNKFSPLRLIQWYTGCIFGEGCLSTSPSLTGIFPDINIFILYVVCFLGRRGQLIEFFSDGMKHHFHESLHPIRWNLYGLVYISLGRVGKLIESSSDKMKHHFRESLNPVWWNLYVLGLGLEL